MKGIRVLPVLLASFFSSSIVASMSPPKIKSFSFNPEASEGHREQVFCTVFKGNPPLTFTWYKDGIQLKTFGRISVQELDQFVSTLTVSSISSDDIGNYTCTARNHDGTDSYTATLIVKASAIFIKELTDISGTEDSTLGLDCLVKGYPKPTITWSKNNVDGPQHHLSVNSVRPLFFPNGTLLFRDLHKNDAGHYTCRVTNGVGTPIEKTITLSVHSSPKVNNITSRQTIPSGHVATIECDVAGDPPLEVVWIKGQSEVREGDRYELRGRPTEDGLLAEMTIHSTTRSDAGIYSCRVHNKFGENERKTVLRVVETPESPKEIKIVDVWSRSVQVSWSSAYDGGSPLVKYILQYWKDVDGIPHRLQEVLVPPSLLSYLLKQLDPGVQYALRVIAESDVGKGHSSITVTFHTEEEAPTGSPTDVVILSKGTNSISIGWNPPPREGWNGVIKGYYAGIKPHGSNERYAFFTVSASPPVDSHMIKHIFHHLKKASRYSIVIKAFNGAGTGPNTHELQAETRDTGLSKPQQFYVSDSDAHTVRLKWKKLSIEKKNCRILIHWRQVGSPSWTEYQIGSEEESYTVTELEPGTKYQSYLTTHGPGDISSEPTDTLTVVTDGVNDHLPESSASKGAFVEETLPKLIRMEVLIPILACIVIISTVIVLACAYVARSKTRYIAMADAQFIGAYDTARLSQCYHPNSPSGQGVTAPSDETSYDAPWDVPPVRA